jgi:hypothetical protein
MGNGKVTSEHGEGRAGATGARTRPHDTRKTSSQLPERAWAPELTAAASNKAKTQTIAKGESMPTQPANWQAASGGAPYGASPSTRPHSRKFADDLSSNSHGLTMVEKRSAGGGSEGDTSAGGRTDSRYELCYAFVVPCTRVSSVCCRQRPARHQREKYAVGGKFEDVMSLFCRWRPTQDGAVLPVAAHTRRRCFVAGLFSEI